jgi:C-terminal processing protease CtpA/Prc
MKKLNISWIVALALLTIWGCSDSSNPTGSETQQASSQKQFVWNAMNFWYYWQQDVPALADSRFRSDQEFQEYLLEFENAEAVFNSLLYSESDDFSFFIDNYEEFQQSQQGISESFGYEFGLIRLSSNSNDILGYVQYIVPDSPADRQGLERGDIFLEVDGTQLTVNNYQDLLQGTTSYELSLAEIENESVSLTGETVTLEAETLQENPIYTATTIDTSSTKVGYLMYNGFQTNSHQDLNDAFGNFQSQGIDELVLDLRYNGGGSGITSQMLAGMISGLDDSNIFSIYAYNNKRAALDTSVTILDEVPTYNEQGQQESTESMNQLSLDRVYILTGRGTASASEVLINGLDPYMEVVLVGVQTVGKDEGSYTLYDAPSPYLDEEEANPDHKMAIQPIILKVVNKNNRAYPVGFEPDHTVDELDYLQDLPPLATADDPLLGKALELITGQPMAKEAQPLPSDFRGNFLINSQEMEAYPNGLYLGRKAVPNAPMEQ